MSWPRPIQGHPGALSLEGLRQRLGACPQCGATPQLHLEPAKLVRQGRRRILSDDTAARELCVVCTSCRGTYRIAAGGAIQPAERTDYPGGTRLFLAAFSNGRDDSASGAELSYELAADSWAGASFEETVLALKARLEQQPP